MANRRDRDALATLGSQTGLVTGDLALETGRFMWRRPVRTALFVTGLLVFAFASGLTPPNDRVAAYEMKLPTDKEASDIARLEARVANARATYHDSQGWFWTCSGPCISNRARFEAASAELSNLVARWHNLVSDAKAELGPYSKQAVDEMRGYFWSHIRDGWRIATDFTKWDMLFSMLSRRDDSFAELLVRLLFNALSNLAIGMFTAVSGFILGVWGVIRTYQPTAVEGAAVFLIAVLAAVSWLVLACAGIVAVVAVPVAVVSDVARLTAGPEARGGGVYGTVPPPRPRAIPYHRPHGE